MDAAADEPDRPANPWDGGGGELRSNKMPRRD